MNVTEAAKIIFNSEYNKKYYKYNYKKVYNKLYHQLNTSRLNINNLNFNNNDKINDFAKIILNKYRVYSVIAKKLFNSKYNINKLSLNVIAFKVKLLNKEYNKKLTYKDIINNKEYINYIFSNLRCNETLKKVLSLKDNKKINKYNLSDDIIKNRFWKNSRMADEEKLIYKIYSEPTKKLKHNARYEYRGKLYTIIELVDIAHKEFNNKDLTMYSLTKRINKYGTDTIDFALKASVRKSAPRNTLYKVILNNNLKVPITEYLEELYSDRAELYKTRDKVTHKLRYYGLNEISEDDILKVINKDK